jgi:hypothetical protein
MLKNRSGKPLDDLDVIKLRVFARETVGACGFHVSSEDGRPITGFVPNEGGEIVHLVAAGWKSEPPNLIAD